MVWQVHEHTLVRDRLTRRLEIPADLTFVAGVMGSGRRTLISHWAASEPSDELRIVVDRRVGGQTDNAAWATVALADRVRSQWGIDARALFPGLFAKQIESQIAAVQAVEDHLGRSIHFGFLDLDRVNSELFIEEFSRFHRALPRMRVVGAASDPRSLIRIARELGFSIELVEDHELFFTCQETQQYLTRVFGGDAEAAKQLYRASNGHPSLIRVGIAELQRQDRGEALTRASILAAWRKPLLADCADVGVYRVIGRSLLAPRVSPETSGASAGLKNAEYEIERMVAFGLGTMHPIPARSTSYFVWDEAWRQWLLQTSGLLDDAAMFRSCALSLSNAAQATGDVEISISAQLDAGEYAEAERLLAEFLWEAYESSDAVAWTGLLRARPEQLHDYPLLRLFHTVRAVADDPSNQRLRNWLRREARSLLRLHPQDPDRRFTYLVAATQALLAAGDRDTAAEAWQRHLDLDADLRGVRSQAGPNAKSTRLFLAAQQALTFSDLPRALAIADDARALIDTTSGIVFRRRLDSVNLFIAHLKVVLGDALTRAEHDAIERYVPSPSASDQTSHAVVSAWRRIDQREVESCSGDVFDPPRTLWATTSATHSALVFGSTTRTDAQTQVSAERLRAMRRGQARKRPLEETGPRAMQRHAEPLSEAEARLREVEALALEGTATLSIDRTVDALDSAASTTPGNRLRHASLLLRAVQARRAGHHAFCLSLLRQAYELGSGRYAPLALAVCKKTECAELVELARLAEEPAIADYLARAVQYGTRWAAAENELPDLTERELLLLRHLSEDRTVREIADELLVSVSTVKFHRSNLYRKLGVSSRDEALSLAVERGIW